MNDADEAYEFRRFMVTGCLLVILINLVPVLAGVDLFMRDMDYDLRRLIVSDEFVYLTLVVVAVAIPATTDLLTFFLHRAREYLFERTVLIIACTTPFYATFCLRHQYLAGTAFVALLAAQNVLICAVLLHGFQQSKLLAWHPGLVRIGFTLFCVGNLYTFFNLPGDAGYYIHVFCGVCYVASYTMLLLGLVSYTNRLWRLVWVPMIRFPVAEYMPLFSIALFWIYETAFFFAVLYWKVVSLEDVGFTCLTFFAVLSVMVTVAANIFPPKISYFRANEIQSLVDTKDLLVRTVGHNLRASLSAAYIGLELLSADVSRPLSINMSARPLSSSRRPPSSNMGRPGSANISNQSVDDLLGITSFDNTNVVREAKRSLLSGVTAVDSLSLFDKICLGNLKLDKNFLMVSDLVYDTLDVFTLEATAKRINFMVEVEENLPLLYADESKLKFMLVNLTSNALKFTAVGGSIHVSVSRSRRSVSFGSFPGETTDSSRIPSPALVGSPTRSGKGSFFDGCLLIQFKDNGIGIRKERLAKLIENSDLGHIHQRTSCKGEMGTGLGIAKAIVEAHHGSMSVCSDGPGTGSMFSVVIPMNDSCSRKRIVANKLSEEEGNGAGRSWMSHIPALCFGRQLNMNRKIYTDENLLGGKLKFKPPPPPKTPDQLEGNYAVNDAHQALSPKKVACLNDVGCSVEPIRGDRPEQVEAEAKEESYGRPILSSLSIGSGIGADIIDGVVRPGSASSPGTVVRCSSLQACEERLIACHTALRSYKWLIGYTALVVDDAAGSLKLLCMLLRKVGCKCLAARDGVEAVSIIQKVTTGPDDMCDIDDVTENIDFVLMTDCMPNMKGAEAIKEIRSLGYNNPIIALSGYIMEEEISNLKIAGANRVVTKPISLKVLHMVLKEVLPTLAGVASW
jgi:signal transduction histidine kinase